MTKQNTTQHTKIKLWLLDLLDFSEVEDQEEGLSYLEMANDTIYKWNLKSDKDISKALEVAERTILEMN